MLTSQPYPAIAYRIAPSNRWISSVPIYQRTRVLATHVTLAYETSDSGSLRAWYSSAIRIDPSSDQRSIPECFAIDFPRWRPGET